MNPSDYGEIVINNYVQVNDEFTLLLMVNIILKHKTLIKYINIQLKPLNW